MRGQVGATRKWDQSKDNMPRHADSGRMALGILLVHIHMYIKYIHVSSVNLIE